MADPRQRWAKEQHTHPEVLTFSRLPIGAGPNSVAAGNHDHPFVPLDIVDSKGDILVGATTDSLVRLPVGANGQVLTADSTATNGVAWAAGDSNHDGTGANSTALGQGSVASVNGATAIGDGASAAGIQFTTAIGRSASASSDSATALGKGANASGQFSVAINGTASAQEAMTLGGTASALRSVSLGNLANSSADYAVSLGYQAAAAGSSGVALGRQASAAHSGSVALGYFATTTAASQIMLGIAGRRVMQPTPNSAPTDADIPSGFITAYLDQTTNKLHFRVKYSDGTLKTGEVALA